MHAGDRRGKRQEHRKEDLRANPHGSGRGTLWGKPRGGGGEVLIMLTHRNKKRWCSRAPSSPPPEMTNNTGHRVVAELRPSVTQEAKCDARGQRPGVTREARCDADATHLLVRARPWRRGLDLFGRVHWHRHGPFAARAAGPRTGSPVRVVVRQEDDRRQQRPHVAAVFERRAELVPPQRCAAVRSRRSAGGWPRQQFHVLVADALHQDAARRTAPGDNVDTQSLGCQWREGMREDIVEEMNGEGRGDND
eukprot:350689-Chlamydomonas_euryale.AAC.2